MRKTKYAILIIVVLCFCWFAILSQIKVDVAAGEQLVDDWPMFHHDASHTGQSTSTAVRQIQWNYTTGNQVMSSPAIVNGIVYVGSRDHCLYALNAFTGSKNWVFPTSNAIESSPTIADGTAYFVTVDGHLYAVNASTGDYIWGYSTNVWTHNSPLVVQDLLCMGFGNGSMCAFNASTGTKIWDYTTGGNVLS